MMETIQIKVPLEVNPLDIVAGLDEDSALDLIDEIDGHFSSVGDEFTLEIIKERINVMKLRLTEKEMKNMKTRIIEYVELKL